MSLPDFLVIGAQKAGTTWLYEQLKGHPQVWLPPIKEIHYFDRGRRPLVLDALRGRHQRAMLWRWVKPGLADLMHHPSQWRWHGRFYCAARSDAWYARCFAPAAGQRAGDITPAYARLGDDAVEHVARLLPHAPIIYILRDPVERMWSQAAMYFARYGHTGLANATPDALGRFLDWDLARANNCYAETITRWRQHCGEERVHIAFFDQLQQDPEAFLRGVCAAIGVSMPEFGPQLHHPVHAGWTTAMPPEIRQRLIAENHDQLERLHRLLDSPYTAAWLEKARGHIG